MCVCFCIQTHSFLSEPAPNNSAYTRRLRNGSAVIQDLHEVALMQHVKGTVLVLLTVFLVNAGIL